MQNEKNARLFTKFYVLFGVTDSRWIRYFLFFDRLQTENTAFFFSFTKVLLSEPKTFFFLSLKKIKPEQSLSLKQSEHPSQPASTKATIMKAPWVKKKFSLRPYKICPFFLVGLRVIERKKRKSVHFCVLEGIENS